MYGLVNNGPSDPHDECARPTKEDVIKQFEKFERNAMITLPPSDEQGDNGQGLSLPELSIKALSDVWSCIDDTCKASVSEIFKRLMKSECESDENKDKIFENNPNLYNNIKYYSKKFTTVSFNANGVQRLVLVPTVCVLRNIGRCFFSTISIKRCAKIIVDECLGNAGRFGGEMLAVWLFTTAGSAACVGATVCALIGHLAAKNLSDRLTQYIFHIPKDEALENAYNFIGVKPTASNNEIKTAFRMLCNKYYPEEKNGEKCKFVELLNHMAIIKAAREQTTKNKN